MRKTIFAVATIAAVGAAALIPSEASAKGFGHHRGLWGFGAAALLTAGAIEASCYRWVDTRYGPVRVYVCQ
jgi:hypothetical protein